MTTANGFSCVADLPPLSIEDDNIAEFTLPQEVLTYEPDDLTLISKFAGGDQERKIHCNLEQRSDEMERLKLLQDEAKKLGRTYYTSITAMATRYISYARGNPTKAVAMMDETQQWRTDFFGSGPLEDKSLLEDMSHGILYFTGRDSSLRPILVIRAERLPDAWHKDGTGVTRLIRMLIFCMEYLRRYMWGPGKVENLVVLVDLKNLGIADVPLKALKSIYSVLSHHYIVRVFRFYIVNMSYMLSTLIGVVKPILTDRQRQKLNFLKSVSECREFAALHQLEEDLGGTRPKITKFFPFPLMPGPFECGSTAGARPDAVKNCHKVFTPAGFRGRLWDITMSKEENTAQEYTEFAEDIFKECGLPVPKGCPIKEVIKPVAEEAAVAKVKIVVSLDDFRFPENNDKLLEKKVDPIPESAPEELKEKSSEPERVMDEKSSLEVQAPEAQISTSTKETKPTPKKCCCTIA